MATIAIYVREHTAHAWKYECIQDSGAVDLVREVNGGFHVDTLLVPLSFFPKASTPGTRVPEFLNSCHVQAEFDVL